MRSLNHPLDTLARDGPTHVDLEFTSVYRRQVPLSLPNETHNGMTIPSIEIPWRLGEAIETYPSGLRCLRVVAAIMSLRLDSSSARAEKYRKRFTACKFETPVFRDAHSRAEGSVVD